MRRSLTTSLKRRVLQLARQRLYVVDRYRYVFIVTYGRSGSTLLMGILNAIPGYRVHGENSNVLFRLHQAAAAVATAHQMYAGNARHREPRSPWYGIHLARPKAFQRELVNSFVTQILRPRPGDRVLGFKEIRYTKGDVPDLPGFLDFLRRSFPSCKIIFNHRDLADVAKSSWWAQDPKAAKKLAIADARMREFPSDERHFHFCYDKINDGLDHIRELFSFLDEEFDEATIRAVLDTRHSPPPTKYAEQRVPVTDATRSGGPAGGAR